MFTLAGSMYGDKSEESVAGQRAVLDLVTEPAAPWQGVWADHRGAVLYILECLATVPVCWARPEGAGLIRVIREIAVRERGEAVPLRNGLSFTVVETFVDRACESLAAGGAAEEWLGAAERLLSGSWEAARAWVERPTHPTTAGPRPQLLGVPFEIVCPGPWRPGVEQLAREFRALTRQDVTLYDSAPLVVPLCALACASGREVSPDRLHLDPGETWPQLLARVYDLAGIEAAGIGREGVSGCSS
jgi:hypothetical protein